ncbi:MAG TPA: lipid kinase YegS [Gammaproteobacteria bacterium]|nr:lipid kinase YegS [Gammaproteobacteria bacterium]
MADKDAYLILHPRLKSHTGVFGAVEQLRGEGRSIEIQVPDSPAGSQALAARLAQTGAADTVIAGGGDGTLNAVATGLLSAPAGQRPALGVLPLGTANDFARGCGIPLQDPLAALRLVLERPPVPIDVGRCGERFFVNVATGGFGAEVTAGTDPALKQALGAMAYLLTGISRLGGIRARQARFSGGGRVWEGRFLAMAAGNGRYAGGGVDVCPGARIDDGLLDVSVVPEVPEDVLARALARFMREGSTGDALPVQRWTCSRLEVRARDDLHVNLDGEPLCAPELLFSILPAALACHLPPDCPLLTRPL